MDPQCHRLKTGSKLPAYVCKPRTAASRQTDLEVGPQPHGLLLCSDNRVQIGVRTRCFALTAVRVLFLFTRNVTQEMGTTFWSSHFGGLED